jgi:hypothetical protein
MPLIRNLLFHAARRAMNDERFRQKASETLEKEIKPRIDAALSKAKPRVDETREDIKNIAAEKIKIGLLLKLLSQKFVNYFRVSLSIGFLHNLPYKPA